MDKQSTSPRQIDEEIKKFIDHLSNSIVLLSALEKRGQESSGKKSGETETKDA